MKETTEAKVCVGIDFAYQDSFMVLGWLCPECKSINYESWSSFDAYKGLVECAACEKAVRLKVPWVSK